VRNALETLPWVEQRTIAADRGSRTVAFGINDRRADLREVLLGTGDAVLVEHTENDSYRGDGGDGRGRNVLGRIFMRVRAKLRSQGAEA
jgi:predicted NAD-dependent protein-ADP-ribosyltransferase YbiA (DUF1768 family)